MALDLTSALASGNVTFGPGQDQNKYSRFPDVRLPFMGLMGGGAPTDALGRPIPGYGDAAKAAQADYQAQLTAYNARPQQPTGTTLNSAPSAFDQTMQAMGMGGAAKDMQSRGMDPRTLSTMIFGVPMPDSMLQPTQQAAAPAAAPAPPQPPDMSAQYLAALQRPDHVATPGATVPEAPPPSGSSSVMDQFLANWRAKGSPTTGAGNYNNAGFYAGMGGG